MDERCIYQLELRGPVEVNDLNAGSPIQMAKVRVSQLATQFTVCTDQSGLLGLMRYLHGRGLTLLCIHRERYTLFLGE